MEAQLNDPIIKAHISGGCLCCTRKSGAWLVITEPIGNGSFWYRQKEICNNCGRSLGKDEVCFLHPKAGRVKINHGS